jgi:hypothetical protein
VRSVGFGTLQNDRDLPQVENCDSRALWFPISGEECWRSDDDK